MLQIQGKLNVQGEERETGEGGRGGEGKKKRGTLNDLFLGEGTSPKPLAQGPSESYKGKGVKET